MKIIKFTGVNGDFKLLKINQLQEVIEQVFDRLDIQQTTKKDYQARIKIFLNFIKFKGFNQNSFLEFKHHLRNQPGFTISTKNKYLIAAKVFLKELFRQGLLPTDLTANIRGFKQNKRHKKDGLSDEDILNLIRYCNTMEETSNNTRSKALLALFLFQGLRQIEVIRLNVEDIDLAKKISFIQCKGHDDKVPIPLHSQTIEALKQYLKVFKIKEGALFRSRSNNSRDQRLTTKSIRQFIKVIFKEAGINRTVHGFRHYYVTKLIKSYKGDLLKVAQYTRHKSLEMLQVYNDDILQKEDLPKYYKAFKGIKFL